MLIKIDLLSVECLDKIHTCLDLLIENNYINKEKTLKETYEKVLGIYNIERTDKDMWRLVWDHGIQALFQMEKQSGIQGISLTKPESVDDLAVLNSVIRLMAQNKNEEQPLVKYARFKNDINLWYQEMDRYGLTKSEQELLKPVVGLAYGICESQEKFMTLVQMPECGGFDLTWADRLRKAIAKKNPKEYDKLTEEYFSAVKEKGLSKNLCNYVWNVLVATSRGYGFNASHTLAYSLVALQEMNLGFIFPIIFWNCACLIVDSGGAGNQETDDEDEEENSEDKKNSRSTDYKKIATAIGKMKQAGIIIEPPDINNSSYTFTPVVEENKILYGLSGLLNVGEDVILDIIKNRPYISIKDFYERVKPKKQAMISLIKAGAFDKMEDRKFAMAWYLWEVCDKKQRLTLQNLGGLIKYDLIPKETPEQIMAYRVYEFNRYLKAITKADKNAYNGTYTLDNRAINFLIEIDCENLIETDNLAWFIKVKTWDNIYQKYMNIFRNWIASDKDNILKSLNTKIFSEDWNKYASGTISAWEMEVMCFYYHEHELINVNNDLYGFVDFFKLPEEPVVDRSYFKGGKEIHLYKLHRICGTCIAKNKTKGTVSLLTTTGVVEVKFRKEYFSMFDKTISERGEDGIKHTIEKSWFNRGSMIIVNGMRSGDTFISKKYASMGNTHQLYKIKNIYPNGKLVVQSERVKGIEEDD